MSIANAEGNHDVAASRERSQWTPTRRIGARKDGVHVAVDGARLPDRGKNFSVQAMTKNCGGRRPGGIRI